MKKTLSKIAKMAMATSMAIIMMAGSTPHLVRAATKTAHLTNAKISFNGGAVKEVQTYNVDGFNFIRARDVTDALNMKILALDGDQPGIIIASHAAAISPTAMERLTQQSAKVNVVKGSIVYSGNETEVEMFALNDRYYFKLADMQAASDVSYQGWHDLNVGRGDRNNPYGKEPVSEMRMIKVSWDEATSVVNVDALDSNFRKQFDEMKAGKTPTPVSVTNTNPQNNAPIATVPAPAPVVNTPATIVETPAPVVEVKAATGDMDARQEAVDLTNAFRAESGLSPVKLNNDIMIIAQARAEKMAEGSVNDRGHDLPDGYGKANDTSKMLGYDLPWLYESVYRRHPSGNTPVSVIQGWAESSAHRANMLNEQHTKIGIGFALDDDGNGYWVQIFAQK